MFSAKPCQVCLQKDEFIQNLLQNQKEPCVSCINLRAEVAYLQNQINNFREDWHTERAEFKRSVDALMELAGSRPVGQGPTPPPTKTIDVADLVGIFDEVPES